LELSFKVFLGSLKRLKQKQHKRLRCTRKGNKPHPIKQARMKLQSSQKQRGNAKAAKVVEAEAVVKVLVKVNMIPELVRYIMAKVDMIQTLGNRTINLFIVVDTAITVAEVMSSEVKVVKVEVVVDLRGVTITPDSHLRKDRTLLMDQNLTDTAIVATDMATNKRIATRRILTRDLAPEN
jgi:hypothetical protein